MPLPLTRLINVYQDAHARHKELSVLLSLDDEPFRPTRRLLALAAEVVRVAHEVDLSFFERRTSTESRWYEIYPGEHYMLLAALTMLLRPKCIVEIGTFTGMSALTMAAHLPTGGRLVTFDIISWQQFPKTWFTEVDFNDGTVIQKLDNLADPVMFSNNSELLLAADLVFLDGPKDGHTEWEIISNFKTLDWIRHPILVIDDIRLLNMIQFWRSIDRPKLDLTSFGHWSGTGVVDWNPSE